MTRIFGRLATLLALLLVAGLAAATGWMGRESYPHNADWTPRGQEFASVEMVYVPAGCFWMGTDDMMVFLAQPRHVQCLHDGFWIDRYEVTNAEWRRCVDAGACSLPESTGYYHHPDYSTAPVAHINYAQVTAYLDWRGARLPTEREWEYAARGPDSLLYPWGNRFEENRAVVRVNGPQPVGSLPGGVSWVGAYDLSGNVYEWTSSRGEPSRFSFPYDPIDGREARPTSPYVQRVLRGGGFNSDFDDVSSLRRVPYSVIYSFESVGFRAVYDP
jgi:formylglycine-generating enzyme required for sulfatase activity